MLGGLALKWRWRERMRAGRASRPTARTSSTGANVQVCWEKFCRYWDVEPRLVPMEGDRFHLERRRGGRRTATRTRSASRRSSARRSTAATSRSRRSRPRSTSSSANAGIDIPIHVDAASGGFVAPFLQPDLEWDFRIDRVQSINASGHKYGLVYPGVGWAIWRDAEALPRDLVFDVNYLGGHMPTFALNFSRPGSEVVAQYYMFASLGREGYRAVMQALADVARYLAAARSPRSGPTG